MSVEFTDPSAVQNINFGSPAGAVGLTAFSVSLWMNTNDVSASADETLFKITDGPGTDTDQEFYIYRPDAFEQRVAFGAHFSTTDGLWRTTYNVLTTSGQWYHIVVTFDGSSSSNNPVMYVDGASKAVTEGTAPSGTFCTGTSANLYVGSNASGFSPDGKITDLRIYTGILTAAQVLALYNDGAFTPNFDTNLVFHAPLNNCTALSGSAYDGYTLTSSQLFSDRIGCAVGTPTGSPLGSATNPS